MRKLFLLMLLGCAPNHYLFDFDLTDPGAQNFKDFRRPDALEDADVKVEIRADPTEFKAVAVDITNKTDQPVNVNWGGIFIVGPDQEQRRLNSNAMMSEIEPGAKVSLVLTPFELPSVGSAAKFYDNSDFQFVLPLVVRGQPREMHYHLHVKLTKL
jgi:hypothetical protein